MKSILAAAIVLLAVFVAQAEEEKKFNPIETRLEEHLSGFVKENPKFKEQVNAKILVGNLRQDELTKISLEELEQVKNNTPLHTKGEFKILLETEKKTANFRNALDEYLLKKIKVTKISHFDKEVLYRYFSYVLLSRERQNYIRMKARAKLLILACQEYQRVNKEKKLPETLKGLLFKRHLTDQRALTFLDMKDMKEKAWRYDPKGKIKYGDLSLVIIAPAESIGEVIIGLNDGSIRGVSPKFLASLEKGSKKAN